MAKRYAAVCDPVVLDCALAFVDVYPAVAQSVFFDSDVVGA